MGGKEGKRVEVGSQLYTDDHKPKAKRTKTRRKAKKTKRGAAKVLASERHTSLELDSEGRMHSADKITLWSKGGKFVVPNRMPKVARLQRGYG